MSLRVTGMFSKSANVSESAPPPTSVQPVLRLQRGVRAPDLGLHDEADPLCCGTMRAAASGALLPGGGACHRCELTYTVQRKLGAGKLTLAEATAVLAADRRVRRHTYSDDRPARSSWSDR